MGFHPSSLLTPFQVTNNYFLAIIIDKCFINQFESLHRLPQRIPHLTHTSVCTSQPGIFFLEWWETTSACIQSGVGWTTSSRKIGISVALPLLRGGRLIRRCILRSSLPFPIASASLWNALYYADPHGPMNNTICFRNVYSDSVVIDLQRTM